MDLGVAHHVEVDELLELEGGGCYVLEDVHEEGGDVLAVGHVGDDAADRLLLGVDVHVVQLLLQLPDLPRLLGLRWRTHPFKCLDLI